MVLMDQDVITWLNTFEEIAQCKQHERCDQEHKFICGQNRYIGKLADKS